MRPLPADSVEVSQRTVGWDKLSGASVLVTGAGGFLGSALVTSLLARHDATGGVQPKQVIAGIRMRSGPPERLPSHPALTLHDLDLACEFGPLPHFDYLIHAASLASPKHYGPNPVGTILPNILGTQRLLEAARATGAAGFLFVSSGEVYGELPDSKIPTAEEDYGYLDPMNPRACYAESKRCGEALCVAYGVQFGFRTVVARPFHTYGPGIALDDGRVFADFVSDVVHGRSIRLKSAGTARRAFCYVTDAVAGILTVLLTGVSGQAYNVGNTAGEIGIAELAELLAGLFPERKLQVERSERAEDGYLVSPISRNVPSTAKLESLGWRAEVDLRDGFRRTVLAIEAEMGICR